MSDKGSHQGFQNPPERETKGEGPAVWVRRARTWGPLPECLHLDKRPSEQHNTKKL